MVSTTAPAPDLPRRRAVTTPAARPVLDDQVLDRRLDHLEVGRGPDRRLHGRAVELAVGLGARPLHGRPLGAVEQPELDAGRVGHPAHQAVQRIDLAHQVALAEPADGRIAGHLADGRELVRDQRRARAHARRRGRRLAAGMPAADHDDVEGCRPFSQARILRAQPIGPTRSIVSTAAAEFRHAGEGRHPATCRYRCFT